MRKGKYQSKGTKIVVLMLAMMLVFGCAMGGTLAFLMAESEVVENTFTVGNIEIALAETTGTDYKIIPGATVNKNPTVTVKAKSEKCYVYVMVDNTVVLDGTVVAIPNIDSTKWSTVKTVGTKTLYRYFATVDTSASESPESLPVFTTVTYSGDIEKDDITTLTNTKITIQAFAHQADNTTQTVADAAAEAQFSLS